MTNDYYTKGPNARKQHKKNYNTQVRRASTAKADSCSFRPLSSFNVASYLFELEIQASNRKLEHEVGVFSQLEADDETENPEPYFGTCMQYPITTTGYDSNSGLSSQSFNSFLPLPCYNDLSPQIIESHAMVGTSNWTQFTMLKACKALGVNVSGFKQEILDVILKNGRKEETSYS